jgi:hypothetical protein
MNTKANIIAVAAVLATIAAPSIASAQQAIFLPSSSGWDQTEMSGVPTDAHGSVLAPAHHRGPHAVRPYGQW